MPLLRMNFRKRRTGNLSVNAVQHAHGDMPVYVLVYRHAAAISVSVKNYGEVVSLGEQSACFGRYYGAGRNANEKSSVLGLAIAKGIVEKERDSI